MIECRMKCGIAEEVGHESGGRHRRSSVSVVGAAGETVPGSSRECRIHGHSQGIARAVTGEAAAGLAVVQ